MYALNLDTNNRILSATYDEYAPASQPRVETLPDGDISDYLYQDGEYVYSEAPWKATERIQAEIAELKGNLANTDYVACKIAEGSATQEEYATVIAQRQAWRERINELEN